MTLRHMVTPEQGGQAFGDVLRQVFSLSEKLIRRLKKTDGLKIDGVHRFTAYLVTAGDVLTVELWKLSETCDNIPEDGEIAILHEEEGFLAVNKPSGTLVHPSYAKNEGTLANFVAGYLQNSGQAPVCHVVNRLDRDTTGVVIFAKNTYMKARLSAMLTAGEKYYTAVCHGKIDPSAGTIDLPIRRIRDHDMERIVATDGKCAVTHYQTVKTEIRHGQPVSVLDILLETGRTHQIRVHSKARGVPLLGDCLYFTEESRALSEKLGVFAQLLHCRQLKFCHPLTGKRVEIVAALPEEMGQVVGNSE